MMEMKKGLARYFISVQIKTHAQEIIRSSERLHTSKSDWEFSTFIILIWGSLKPLSQSFVRDKIYMELLGLNT